jgi:hypothetical protein
VITVLQSSSNGGPCGFVEHRLYQLCPNARAEYTFPGTAGTRWYNPPS